MNHKSLGPAVLCGLSSTNNDNMLFNLLMITRRCFLYIPGFDVNSFGKKVTGQNQRPKSCDEGEFPVCWCTTKSTLSTERVM